MKRFIVLVLILILTLHLTTVSAEVFPNSLPGGKNYLNPENVEIQNGTLSTMDSIFVKSNQEYTFSIPNRDLLGEGIYVLIEGEVVYTDEFAPESICVEEQDVISCVFTTTNSESSITISIEAELLDLYYMYYSLQNFQLEEGSIRTDYEEYIAPYIDSTSPEFTGTGAYIKSYEESVSVSEIVSSHIIAFDEIDGDLSDQIVVVTDEYTGNETTIGQYLVELSVSDTSGNVARFDLYILVKDEIAPVITGPSDVYIPVEAENEIENMIDAYMEYSDAYDRSPTVTITYDDYTPNVLVVGSYLVSFDVKDSSGNTTSKDFTIHIEDIYPPVLESSTSIDVDVSNPMNIDEIIDGVIATDNYDQTVDIIVFRDYYTGNETTTGTYFVDIILSDDSGNETPRTLMVHVNDSSNPEIIGPTEISVSYTSTLSIEDVKSLYTITDNYDLLDSSDLILISDEYTASSDIPGNYQIIFEVVDSNGNKSGHILEVHVVDDVNPIIYIDEYIVIVDIGSTFGENDMLKLLRLSNEISSLNYKVHVLQNEYTGNEEIPGDYVYKVKLTDSEGSEMVREFKITVKDQEPIIDYTEAIVYTLIGIAVLTAAIFYKKYR